MKTHVYTTEKSKFRGGGWNVLKDGRYYMNHPRRAVAEANADQFNRTQPGNRKAAT